MTTRHVFPHLALFFDRKTNICPTARCDCDTAAKMLSRSSGLRTQIRIFVAIQNPSFSLNTDRHAIRNMCVPRHCPLQSIKNTAKFFLVQTRSLTFLFYRVKFNMIDQRVWVQERWNKRACPFSLSVASFGGAMKSCLSKKWWRGKEWRGGEGESESVSTASTTAKIECSLFSLTFSLFTYRPPNLGCPGQCCSKMYGDLTYI